MFLIDVPTIAYKTLSITILRKTEDVNEIEYALWEMYEAEHDGPPTTGNTVGSEYRPAELKDIIKMAIQVDWNDHGFKMGNVAKFIQHFIADKEDISDIICYYNIILSDIKYYTDCYKCNFSKLDMSSMNGICPSKVQDVVGQLVGTEIELLYGMTEDNKNSDIVFVMDNTFKPGGDLIGWFYGEPDEEYINGLITDYKKKLFGEEN